MFDKKKLNFWRLAVIFMGFIAITLISLWLSPQEKKASMMNESMANMANMHLENLTVYDLVGASDTESKSLNMSSSSQVTSDTSTHSHETESNEVSVLGIVTTVIIFVLIPLIICGTIILAIIWIK